MSERKYSPRILKAAPKWVPSQRGTTVQLGGARDAVAIVVPIWQEKLLPREFLRLERTVANCPDLPLIFVVPIGLDTRFYSHRWPRAIIEKFPAEHFSSVEAYSRWLLTESLYNRLISFDFIVIVQTDAFLNRDIKSTDLRFDFVGAPWEPSWKVGWDPLRSKLVSSPLAFRKKTLVVGNGGLSIRRTSKFAEFVQTLPRFRGLVQEDIAISYFSEQGGLSMPSPGEAAGIFMETEARRWHVGCDVPSVLGFHGLDKINPRLEEEVLRRS